MNHNSHRDLKPWSYEVSENLILRGWEQTREHSATLHFMHGNGLCGMTYWPLLKILSEKYGLCLHDAQGHGDSDPGQQFAGWEKTAKRAQQVIKTRRVDWPDTPVIGMGHSFGGILSLLMAATEKPPFDALVLLDPVIYTPTMVKLMTIAEWFGLSRFHPMSKRAAIRQDTWESRDEVDAYFRGRGVFRGWTDEALQAYLTHALKEIDAGKQQLKCPPWMEAAVFGSYAKGFWRYIQKIQCPVLILYGDKTYPFIAPSVARATRLNPNIKGEQVVGGHCFMQEMPEKTADRITQYIDSIMPV